RPALRCAIGGGDLGAAARPRPRRRPGGGRVKTAAWPREEAEAERLLVVDPATETIADSAVGDLPSRLRAGDLLPVNDAATLRGGRGGGAADGARVEVRLVGANDDGPWTAALLGAGNWGWRTEDRPAPPRLEPGAVLAFGEALRATVVGVSDVSPRL